MTTPQLAEFLDSIDAYENMPWVNWFTETFCNNCEGITQSVNQRSCQMSYCEVSPVCRFFPYKRPDSLDIVSLWLEYDEDGQEN